MTNRSTLTFSLMSLCLLLTGCQSVDSATLEQRMAPCGVLPNCYRSGSEHPRWELADGSPTGWAGFVDRLRQRERWTLVAEAENYVHFSVRTPLLRFADDVEFLRDPSSGAVSYRSASRLGLSDLGANRQRLVRLAAELETAGLLLPVAADGEAPAG